MAAERDDEKLNRLYSYLRAALDHPSWVSWRANAQKCFEYRDNEQWTVAELETLAQRHQPPTVNNQIKPTVDRILGRFVTQKTRITYRGRGLQDEDGARALSETYRYTHQSNKLEFEERECFEDGVVGGFGCLYSYVTFDDLLAPEIRVQHVDAFEVFPDPHSRRYNWNEDAQHITWGRWYTFDEAMRMKPGYAEELRTIANGSGEPIPNDGFKNDHFVQFDDKGNPLKIRFFETWYKDYEQDEIIVAQQPDGTTKTFATEDLDADSIRRMKKNGARVLTRRLPKLRVAIWTGRILFSDQEDPHRTGLFPFIPYFVSRKKTGEPYSTIFIALPMQDAINKRESKALHLLNTRQAIVSQNSVADIGAFADELAKPDGILEVRNREEVEIDSNIELASTQFQMHVAAMGDFRRITGVNEEATGQPSNVRSGTGIARKQAAAELVMSPMFDNFRRTRAIWADLHWRLVRSYYTEEKIMLINDDLDQSQARKLILDQKGIESLKNGIYDVVVDEIPDQATEQQEQVRVMFELLPNAVQLGPGWMRLAIEMSDLRNKPELLKRLEEIAPPPPPEPSISVNLSWADMTPDEKVAWAGKLGMPALGEAQRESAEPTEGARRERTETTRELIRAGAMGAQAATKAQADLEKAKISAAKKPEKKAANG